jgi:radical SAM superfamily enzyme YgiQ (UPF0313 family)
MNILLVYPEFPSTTYWSYTHALPFIGKKSAMPPLGLITVAGLIPSRHNLRLVDLNVERLRDRDLAWADMVFTSSMIVQKESLEKVIARARAFKRPVVAGGPYPTQYYDRISGVDHFILGEAESGVLASFLADREAGKARRVYARPVVRKREPGKTIDARELRNLFSFAHGNGDIHVETDRPPVQVSPVPRFDLLKIDAYGSMAVQFSRGCPFNCDFCNEPTLFGNRVRFKSASQLLDELETLYRLEYRGALFAVDDNFIGNIREIKQSLPSIIDFQRKRGYPFSLYTEASINLAKDETLMELMRDAGFDMVFIGIETPDEQVLRSMNKMQNAKTDLVSDVRTIQRYGMEVTAGFIMGHDSDPEDAHEKILAFCRQTGIITVMVGLLTVLKGSPLFERLAAEGRLSGESDGNNTHSFELNFKPAPGRDHGRVVQNYKHLLSLLYDEDGDNYFERCRTLLSRLGPSPKPSRRIAWREVRAFVKSLVFQSMQRYRAAYWKLLFFVLRNRPAYFAEAVRHSITGHHFIEITRGALTADIVATSLQNRYRHLMEHLGTAWNARVDEAESRLAALARDKKRFLAWSRKKIRKIRRDHRPRLVACYQHAIHALEWNFSFTLKWLKWKENLCTALKSGFDDAERKLNEIKRDKNRLVEEAHDVVETADTDLVPRLRESYRNLTLCLEWDVKILEGLESFRQNIVHNFPSTPRQREEWLENFFREKDALLERTRQAIFSLPGECRGHLQETYENLCLTLSRIHREIAEGLPT